MALTMWSKVILVLLALGLITGIFLPRNSHKKGGGGGEEEEEEVEEPYSSMPLSLSSEKILEILKSTGLKLNLTREGKSLNPSCVISRYGTGWGGHELCEMKSNPKCLFYSFGISHDYSFDLDLEKRMGCSGIGFDPTANHSAFLSNNLLFVPMGAKALNPNLTKKFKLVTSVPALRKAQGHELAVLKMDCEGCEYSLARDVVEDDPDFWNHVQQFAVELHVSKFWIKNDDYVHNLALLFLQLEKAGLIISHFQQTGCSPKHEEYGCADQLIQSNFPCQKKGMCLNILFAKAT